MKLTVKTSILIAAMIPIGYLSFMVFKEFQRPPIENAHIQVSRIDFELPIKATQMEEIKSELLTIKGVKEEVIIKENRLVFFHDNRIINGEQIYTKLMKKIQYKGHRFMVPSHLSNAKVCPLSGDGDIVKNISNMLKSIF